jgi:glycolate oxidase
MSLATEQGPPSQRASLFADLESVVGADWLLSQPDDLLLYAYDGSVDHALPDAVVFPDTTDQVQAVVQIAGQHGVPVVPRGAGTGLSGGAIARCGGIVVSTARMNRILEVDIRNRRAVVEPGVVNADLSTHTKTFGFHYAPDPSSQKACTIGGNIATNAGGPHTLLYGVTTNHVLGVEFVTMDAQLVTTSGLADAPGYDITGLVCGSEGTLGIVTKATVQLLRSPAEVKTLLASFDSIASCSSAVSGIVAAGVVPAAVEMMDQLALKAIAQFVPQADLPTDAAAVLLLDLDGVPSELQEQEASIRTVLQNNDARAIRVARDSAERDLFWLGRKHAFGAVGRISPDYYVQDGVIPRTSISPVLEEIGLISRSFDIPIANVFHAGDGNLHPLLLFDNRVAGALDRVLEAGNAILKVCVDAGGMLSGEHGIGMEKQSAMSMVFNHDDLAAMQQLQTVFDPHSLFNPAKIFPAPAGCAEINNLRRSNTSHQGHA